MTLRTNWTTGETVNASDLNTIGTEVNGKEDAANKSQANGYASLDSNGKVPGSQLPNSIMTYEGLHDVSANSPALTDASGDAGQVYRISVAGSRNYGSGTITLDVGDYLIHSGTVWQKADTTDAVSSINGQTGSLTGFVTETGTQSLSNKTIVSPTVSDPALTGTAKVAKSGVFEVYNTADQTTNFERLAFRYNSNVAEIAHIVGGTGAARQLRLITGSGGNIASILMSPDASGVSITGGIASLTAGSTNSFGRLDSNMGTSSTAIAIHSFRGTFSSNGTNPSQAGLSVQPTINQSGTAGYTALRINPTETATGSGTKRLIDAQVGGVSKFVVDNQGNITFGSNPAVTLTAAPTKITFDGSVGNNSPGSNANQKINLYAGYGFGVSASTLEYQASTGASHKFYIGGTERFSISPTAAQVAGVDVVTTSGTQSLSNKTISGSANTLSNISVSSISATGTRDSTTYLRGDGTWAEVSGGITTGKAIAMAMVFG